MVFYWYSVFAERRTAVARLFLAGATLVIVIYPLLAHFNARQLVRRNEPGYRRAAAALLSKTDTSSLTLLYSDPRHLWDLAAPLRTLHLNVFAPRDTDALGQSIGDLYTMAPTDCIGLIDAMHTAPDIPAPGLFAYGWAWDSASKRPVDRVVFTGSTGKIIGFALTNQIRKHVAAPGIRGRIGWEGFLQAAGGETVHAYAVVSPTSACQIGEAVAPSSQRAVLAELRDLGPTIAADIAIAGAWQRDGQHADAGKLALSDPVYGSWVGADQNMGELTFGPFTATTDTVLLPFVTGPVATNLKVAVIDAGTGQTLLTSYLPMTKTWRALSVPLGPDAIGKSLKIEMIDHGHDWGEWLAVGLLHTPIEQNDGRAGLTK
jgi:hypothetical protein